MFVSDGERTWRSAQLQSLALPHRERLVRKVGAILLGQKENAQNGSSLKARQCCKAGESPLGAWVRAGCSNSLLAVEVLVSVLLEAGNELPDTEVLDHLLQDSVVASVDSIDLDLGLLGDEIHLSLSFLL